MIKENILSNPENSGDDIKKIFRQLSFLFHPDQGGDTELMRELLTAYDEAKKGNRKKLDEIWTDWAVNTVDELDKKRSMLVHDLKEKSDELYELIKSGQRKWAAFEYFVLTDEYIKMCSEYGLEPDIEFIVKFLKDEDWLPDDYNANEIDSRIQISKRRTQYGKQGGF